jgi:hypothetical protein
MCQPFRESPTTDEVYDLDLITVGECERQVAFTGNDLTVDLDRHASLTQAELCDEIRNRQPIVQALRLTVDRYVHAGKIVRGPCLYNLGGVW